MLGKYTNVANKNPFFVASMSVANRRLMRAQIDNLMYARPA